MPDYLDTSAFIELVRSEPESKALRAELAGRELRSLDALHLATIISLGEDVERVYCYDTRFTRAAQAHGIKVSEPS